MPNGNEVFLHNNIVDFIPRQNFNKREDSSANGKHEIDVNHGFHGMSGSHTSMNHAFRRGSPAGVAG